jgi:putative DNA primase/helicase
LVTANETEKGRNWKESRLKMLTGGDVVTAHFMRRDDFEYVPKFKPFFTGNDKPGLRSVGVAMRRRLHLIPFLVTILKDERDDKLESKLKKEWSGILQWAVEGCLAWQRDGLAPPDAVVSATDKYFKSQDSFTAWVEDCCQKDPNCWTKTTDLFESWSAWAATASVIHGNIKDFGDQLVGAELHFQHTKRGNGYWGLRIVTGPPLSWDEDKRRREKRTNWKDPDGDG